MKDYFNLRKSKLLLFVLLAVLAGGVSPAWANELTICDGSSTNQYVPIYGFYADTPGSKSEFIVPKNLLEDMEGGTVTSMNFYLSIKPSAAWKATWEVFMREVDDENYSSTTFLDKGENSTVVYTGVLDATTGVMTVSFSNNFVYSGEKNLLVGVYMTTKGSNCPSATFIGEEHPSSCAYQYGTYGSVNKANFIPKIEFSYNAAAGVISKPKNLKVTNVTNTTATINWMAGGTETSWEISYSTNSTEPDANGNYTTVNSSSYELTDLTKETQYFVFVRAIIGNDKSKWSKVSFTTKPDPITDFPYTENFNSISITSGIPANWDNSEGTTTNDSYKWNYYTTGHEGACVRFNSSSNGSGIWNALKTPAMNLPSGKVMQLSFWYKYAGQGDLSVYVSNDGGDTYTTPLVEGLKGQSDWQQIEVSIPNGFQNNVVIVFKGTSDYGSYNIDLDDVTIQEAPMEAKLSVDNTPIAFGLSSSGTKDIVIKNMGGAQMTGVSVSYTATTGVTDAVTLLPALNNTVINANSQEIVTVSINTERKGEFSGIIRIVADEQTSVEIPVSGYVLDNSKILETFSYLPSNWTQSASLSYNATTGVKFPSTERTLTTPTIIVGDNEVLAINAKLSYSSGYITILGSTDGTNWNAFDAKTYNYNNGLNTTDYALVTVKDIPAGTYNLRIKGSDVYINLFNGYSYAPEMGLYDNESCTTTVATEVEKNFGFVTENQDKKYYIKNKGGGQIDLTWDTPEGFTATIDDDALTANEVATLTINMAATEGLHNGKVIVTAKNHADNTVLGTFTVNVNGAVKGSKSDINFASLSEMPAGWELGSWTFSANNYVANSSMNDAELISQTFTVEAGEKMLIEAKGNNSYYSGSLSYSFNGGEETSITDITKEWKVFELVGAPAGQVKVKFTGHYVSIRRVYGFETAIVPVMEFAAAGTTKNFGMIKENSDVETYTINNKGEGELKNLSISCENSNFSIEVTDNATSIEGGKSATFTVQLLADVLGEQSGTITISGDDVDPVSFNVKGYVADNTKIFETFTEKPDNWENSGWSFSTNGAYTGSASNELSSPKISVVEGEKLAISAKLVHKSGSYYYLTVKGSSNNGDDYEAYTKTIINELNTDDYTIIELTDIPATVNKLLFVGNYVYLNGFNGFTVDENDPKFTLYSNEACTAPITDAIVTNAWGFLAENKTATYYIKNTGTGTLKLSKGETPAGFTVSLDKETLSSSEDKATLTISMANDPDTNEGYHIGNVVLTAKDNNDNSLGTFTVKSSGVVVGNKTDFNFAELTEFPNDWNSTGWTVSGGVAKASGYNATLTTCSYSVAAGEALVIEAKGNSSYGTPSLTYQYSTSEGWKSGTSTLTYNNSVAQIQAITDIPAGDNVQIKFTGSYIDISRIYGYTRMPKAAMTLDPDITSYEFTGIQTTDAEYTITVTNTGDAEMTGLTASLETGTNYVVSVITKNSDGIVAVNGTATIYIDQLCKPENGLASLSDKLTISADGLDSKTINLSGRTRDNSKWFVDFAGLSDSKAVPKDLGFVQVNTWKVQSEAASNINTFNETSLITQPINFSANEKLYFEAKKSPVSPDVSPSLKIRYSIDNGFTWSEYADYSSAISSNSSYSSHEIDFNSTDAVTAIIEFSGMAGVYIDNIYGGVLSSENTPILRVTEGDVLVSSGTENDLGVKKYNNSEEIEYFTCEYTINNIGKGDLTISSVEPEDDAWTNGIDVETLPTDNEASLTIYLKIDENYGEKRGTVTVKTNVGDFIINCKGLVLSPYALDEKFDGGVEPAGWTSGTAWSFNDNYAGQGSKSASDLTTMLLKVSDPTDLLTFKAARNTESSSTVVSFNVQILKEDGSKEKDVDLNGLTLTNNYQTVSVKGLDAGYYYLRINGNRVKVDDFLGWEKVLELKDNVSFSEDVVYQGVDIKVNRSFNAGWGTIVLPFDVDAATVQNTFGEGTKLFTLSSYNGGNLNFDLNNDGSIVAGTPYLIKLPAAITNGLLFEGMNETAIKATAKVDVELEGAAFRGNYEAGMSMNGKYGVSPEGKIQKGGESSTMKAFRAYFELTSGAGARIVVNDETTGIREVIDLTSNGDNVYDLSGRKIDTSHQVKGLYIKNGKKVIIK